MSSLSVFLSLPPDYAGPALQVGWHQLSVPPSCHSVKPFLAHLRSSLQVDEAYGFKLSVRPVRGGLGSPSPLGAADAKAITSVAEFQKLFEQLEWADADDGAELTLVVELKKKEGVTPGAATNAAPAAVPRFTAPSKATAKPVQADPSPSAAASAAATAVSPSAQQNVAVAERDPTYRSPFTQSSGSSTSAGSGFSSGPMSSWARQQQEAAQQPPQAETGAGATGVAARLAMFGGASIAAGNRVHNNATGGGAAGSNGTNSSQPARSFVSQPPPPSAKVFTAPTPSPPAPAPTAATTAAAPLPPPPFSRAQPSASQAALAESLRVLSLASAPLPPTQTQAVPPSTTTAAPATVSFVPAVPAGAFGGFGAGDPDLDLPPPPSGFSDPFATAAPASAHAGSTGAGTSAPVTTPASTMSAGSNESAMSALPPPPVSANVPTPAAVGSASVAPVPAPAPAVPQSEFLSHLKSNHATLAFQYAHDSFQEMVQLCLAQEKLFERECVSGVLGQGSNDRDRASNGLLLYLYHLSLAHTALHQFPDAARVAERFTRVYSSLPALMRAPQSSNEEMHIQLLHNAGLALEKAGQPQEALAQLLAAANLVDEGARLMPPDAHVPLRSAVCMALGNLLQSPSALRDLDRAAVWHQRAVDNESLLADASQRKWNVFHAAGSCAAMKGDFLQAVQLDTKAIDLHQANPRVYFNRGLCLQKLNQWNESVADLTRVVTLDPTNAKAFVLRAKALLRQEQWAGVVADCEAALKLAPQDAQAAEFKKFAMQRL